MEKLLFIRTSLFSLVALLICINSSIPTSSGQKENIGANDSIGVTVTHRNITQAVNESFSTKEPGTNDSFVVVDREKTLENQVTNLTTQLQQSDDMNRVLSISLGVVGVLATWGGYRLSKRHLESTIDKSVAKTVNKMVEVANALLNVKEGGKVAIQEDTSKVVARRTVEATIDTIISKQVGKSKENKDDLSKGVKL